MIQKLVKNQNEFMDIFSDTDWQEVEDILNIEFAMSNGMYHDDPDYDEDTMGLEGSDTIFRESAVFEPNFPESYPCVVLYENDKGFDRSGDFQVRYLHFVYPSDFN